MDFEFNKEVDGVISDNRLYARGAYQSKTEIETVEDMEAFLQKWASEWVGKGWIEIMSVAEGANIRPGDKYESISEAISGLRIEFNEGDFIFVREKLAA